MLVEGHNALSNREVLFTTILSDDEEATCFLVLGVGSTLKVSEILELLIFLFMELQKFVQKLRIIAFNLLAVLLQVEDGTRLRLNLVDVEVVHARNLVRSLCALHSFALLLLASALGLLCLAHLILNAKGEVTTLLLPKVLEFLAFGALEFEVVVLDPDGVFAKLIQHVFF